MGGSGGPERPILSMRDLPKGGTPMTARVKVRGIYGSALSRLLLDSGYEITSPSPEVQAWLGPGRAEPPQLLVQDRDNRQGVDLVGETEPVWELLHLLQAHLVDATLLALEPMDERDGWVRARVEFPGAAKESLDRIRSGVVPTLAKHHRLRTIHPRALSQPEQELAEFPERKEKLEKKTFADLVLTPLQKAASVRLEHVRISGRRVRPREGLLVEATAQRVVMQRFFSKGRYDGLNLPIEDGDYALTDIEEGAWFVKHSYYSRTGVLKGEYHNINTPVEMYPHGARYLDLEVDVVCRAGGRPFLVDREKMAILVKEGLIWAGLERRALEVAEAIVNRYGS
jgi:hypothetical protein